MANYRAVISYVFISLRKKPRAMKKVQKWKCHLKNENDKEQIVPQPSASSVRALASKPYRRNKRLQDEMTAMEWIYTFQFKSHKNVLIFQPTTTKYLSNVHSGSVFARVHRSLLMSQTKNALIFYVNIKSILRVRTVRAHTFANEMFEKCAATAWKIFYDKTAFIFNVFMSNKNNQNKHNNNSQPNVKIYTNKHSLIRNDKGNKEKIKEKCWGKTESGILYTKWTCFFLFTHFPPTLTHTHRHIYIRIFQQYFHIFEMKNEEENKNDKRTHTHTYIHHKRHIMNVVKPYMCLYMQEQKKPQEKMK